MELRLGQHRLDCTDRSIVMGILNVSRDSPIGQSRVAPSAALDRAVELCRQGASIIDVGAVSTSSEAQALASSEEIDRVCPVIEALSGEGIPVSLDSWDPVVAEAAAGAGVDLLNDVSGFRQEAMVAVAARHHLAVCVMHMRGEPGRHYEADQTFADIASCVRDFLIERAETLEEAGAGQVWLDPGFEFGKSLPDNLAMFWGLAELVVAGRPVLISASRKGFLAELLGYPKRQDAPGQLEATLAFNTLAAAQGVHVLRVHDVEAISHALAVVHGLARHRSY